MNRWTILAIRATLIGASLWLAFMLPRWFDSKFYDLCPSFNCFGSRMPVFLSLFLGLGTAIALNVAFTLWMRSNQASATNS